MALEVYPPDTTSPRVHGLDFRLAPGLGVLRSDFAAAGAGWATWSLASGKIAATLETPLAGATLPLTEALFRWFPGAGATAYRLSVGSPSIPGLYFRGPTTNATSTTVRELPGDGRPLHVSLETELDGAWVSNTYSLTSAGAPSPNRDFNGDGKSDLILRSRDTGASYMWYMDGARLLRDERFAIDVPLNLRIEATGDFRGTGDSQILLRDGTTGAVTLWVMSLARRIAEVRLPDIAPHNEIMGSGDFNIDGKLDLVVRDRRTEAAQFYLSTGSGFTVQPWFNLTLNYAFVGTGDFNGDGYVDVILRNLSTGDLYYYFMERTTVRSATFVGRTALNFDIIGTGDFNGDAEPDVMVRNNEHGHTFFWLSNPNDAGITTHLIGRTDLSYEFVCR